MRLAQAAVGRDNNLNLIRIVAAAAVLITHSFALSAGSPSAEPLRSWLGLTLGTIAVDVFFVASGFLVTGSLFAKQDATGFIVARALRILPALLVAMVLTVFVLGPAFTRASAAEYFSSSESWTYLVKGISLFSGVAYTLPGVFDGNPYPKAVNGSLWTLPYEVRMYALLVALWVALGVLGAKRMHVMRAALVGAALMSGAFLLVLQFTSEQPRHFVRLFFMFSTGAALCVLKDRIELSGRVATLLSALLALSAMHRDAFLVIYVLSLAYLLMCIAYLPRGWIRSYNAAGDYSYGLYIYAFPIQQAVVALVPGIGPWGLIFASGALTLACAVASWHFIEQPAMRLRRSRKTAGRLLPA